MAIGFDGSRNGGYKGEGKCGAGRWRIQDGGDGGVEFFLRELSVVGVALPTCETP